MNITLRWGLIVLGLCACHVCWANNLPTSTISASAATVSVGQTFTVSVNASDVDGDLYYINIDQVSPNAGYYGAGYDTGNENPPGGAAYQLGGVEHASYTRTLTLTIGTPGSYVFRGMAADDHGSGWQPSSNTVTVVVTTNTGPTITRQPQSRNVSAGFDVMFSVSAVGTGTLTYQWRKENVNISGATSATYTRANVTTADVGNYEVIVTDANGSVTSNNTVLEVVDPNADSDGDGIPDVTETALGTHASTTTYDNVNSQQQKIHRPIQ
jgi:hypothetical protein